jgi:hypothetical protein
MPNQLISVTIFIKYTDFFTAFSQFLTVDFTDKL